jgi:hypothetical protein
MSVPNGQVRSKLMEALTKRRMPTTLTVRNWRTVSELASARVPGIGPGGPAQAADRRRAEGGQNRDNGREARVRLGAGDVGLGAVRQSNPGHAGRGSKGGAASQTPAGPRRNASRALRRERASRPGERGQHRHRDEVSSAARNLVCGPLTRSEASYFGWDELGRTFVSGDEGPRSVRHPRSAPRPPGAGSERMGCSV